MNPLIQPKKSTRAILVVFACFAFLPRAHAVVTDPDDYFPNHTTAVGEEALLNLTSGLDNTAAGWHALRSNTSGSQNTATGRTALLSNTTGSHNTAYGYVALAQNTTGDHNTATGSGALNSNQTGGFNTATGSQALTNNRGSFNTANGAEALSNNTTAFFNTAMGFRALYNNMTGLNNTANGYQALFSNQTGSQNTANGVQALYRTTGGGNIALGFQAGVNLTTGANNIDIGNAGMAGESNKIRIGQQGTHNGTFIAGIRGQTAAGGIPVIVNASGKLGTTISSTRFKEAIKPMDRASEAIHALKPVTFHYKKELGTDGIPQFGLVAEEVEKVNPDLVVRDEKGDPYTVRYDAVNAMLLNEFLKEHKKVQELEAVIAKQQKDFQATATQQQKQIEALTAGLQKVSAQIQMSKVVPSVARNNQ
jgi:Chaperone of endosialidase